MQRTPDLPAMARHARLFELLRQETNARSVRLSAAPPAPADHVTGQEFRDVALRSFSQGRPTL